VQRFDFIVFLLISQLVITFDTDIFRMIFSFYFSIFTKEEKLDVTKEEKLDVKPKIK